MKEDIKYWMSKCASLQHEVDVLNEKLGNVSLIKWQKGEPKEGGTYIITTNEGKTAIASFFVGYSPDIEFFKTCVTAWCKLSDIKPYKEETK